MVLDASTGWMQPGPRPGFFQVSRHTVRGFIHGSLPNRGARAAPPSLFWGVLAGFLSCFPAPSAATAAAHRGSPHQTQRKVPEMGFFRSCGLLLLMLGSQRKEEKKRKSGVTPSSGAAVMLGYQRKANSSGTCSLLYCLGHNAKNIFCYQPSLWHLISLVLAGSQRKNIYIYIYKETG